MAEEKKRKVLEANMNVHINNTVQKMQEELGQDKVNEVVDTAHGTDNGENFEYDSNLDS